MSVKWALHHISGSLKGRVDKFDCDHVTIGRDPTNTLPFDPFKDKKSSAFHAEIERQGNAFWLRDLDSTNGTFVNGDRVIRCQLHSGDTIEFGRAGPRTRFAAVVEPAAAPGAEEASVSPADKGHAEAGEKGFSPEIPTLLRPPRGASRASAEAEAPAADMETKGLAIRHLSLPRKGKMKNFTTGVIRVGRNPEFDLRFDPEHDLAVSWVHAQLVYEEPDWWVEDLGSRNGTFVNGSQQKRCRLHTGDVVQFGLDGPEIEVRILREPSGAHPAAVQAVARTMQWAKVSDQRVDLKERVPALALHKQCAIGRDDPCELVLRHPSVSRTHATITPAAGGYVIRDLGSMNGTFVNGVRLAAPTPLQPGDRIYIGTYVITFQDGRLNTEVQQGNISVKANGLTFFAPGRETHTPSAIIRDVSLGIRPREFVAILGPSGSGKSTLMDLLSGRRRAAAGRVYYNDDDFYASYDFYRPTIGYVPQRDIVHVQLSVYQALEYAVELRLPRDTSSAEVQSRVEEVLDQIELTERRRARISTLSGGELKRVNLGVELISKPNVLFLDEATAGLDAGTDYEMMTVFRRIANEGRTVICITHNVEYVDQCDLAVLLCEGRLVFYGPPADMLRHFRINRVSQVYARLKEQPADKWTAFYRQSESFRTYMAERIAPVSEPEEDKSRSARPRKPSAVPSARRLGLLSQLATLTRRYANVTTRDHWHVGLLLLQAPLIAILLGLVLRAGQDETAAQIVAQKTRVAFFLVLSAIWFGCTNAVREIVKEADIYQHERAVGLAIPSYVLSKIFPLSALCAIQCAVLLLIAQSMTHLGGDWVAQFASLLVTAVVSVLMGLLVSAFVSSGDRAMALVPLLLIPQVLFADVIVRLKGWSLVLAKFTIPAYWAFDAMKTTICAVEVRVGREALALVQGGSPADRMRLDQIPRPALPGEPLYAAIGRVGEWGADMTALAILGGVLLFLIMASLRLKDAEKH